jgi:hypothetical protein
LLLVTRKGFPFFFCLPQSIFCFLQQQKMFFFEMFECRKRDIGYKSEPRIGAPLPFMPTLTSNWKLSTETTNRRCGNNKFTDRFTLRKMPLRAKLSPQSGQGLFIRRAHLSS